MCTLSTKSNFEMFLFFASKSGEYKLLVNDIIIIKNILIIVLLITICFVYFKKTIFKSLSIRVAPKKQKTKN